MIIVGRIYYTECLGLFTREFIQKRNRELVLLQLTVQNESNEHLHFPISMIHVTCYMLLVDRYSVV